MISSGFAHSTFYTTTPEHRDDVSVKGLDNKTVEINVLYLKPVTCKVVMDEVFRTRIFDSIVIEKKEYSII